MSRNSITALIIVGVVAIGVSAFILARRPDGQGVKSDGSAASSDLASGTDEKVVIELLKEPLNLPEFTLTDLDGKKMSSTDWHGKVVLDQLLGDLVRTLPRGNSRPRRAAEQVSRRAGDCRHLGGRGTGRFGPQIRRRSTK